MTNFNSHMVEMTGMLIVFNRVEDAGSCTVVNIDNRMKQKGYEW